MSAHRREPFDYTRTCDTTYGHSYMTGDGPGAGRTATTTATATAIAGLADAIEGARARSSARNVGDPTASAQHRRRASGSLLPAGLATAGIVAETGAARGTGEMATDGYARDADAVVAVEPLRVAARRARGLPLRLLSLDGGGVRGFSTILLIQELMLKVFVELEGRAPRADEIPKPCDHFDLIGGTGTGGLIAILLGRLRLDLETCKAVYVRVSRRVFETDKTIAGIPYRRTLFKASLLEAAIKDVVREMTAPAEADDGGGGETISMYLGSGSPRPSSSPTTTTTTGGPGGAHKKTAGPGSLASGSGSEGGGSSLSLSPRNQKSTTTTTTATSSSGQRTLFGSSGRRPRPRAPAGGGGGNENAPLYDARPYRCRTFVTAVYQGSDDSTGPALLRTYDSSRSPAPTPDCTIWQAGRATCAHFPAFKPIQIGQDVFLDDGPGRYSPVAQVLEEAVVHEWPGRDVGVLVSIGSGKKPGAGALLAGGGGGGGGGGGAGGGGVRQETRRERSYSVLHATPLGRFADARERHVLKMDDCETIHQELLAGLHRTGVARDSYVRLNVETGLGDFGINEWSRMPDISTSTRKYLTKPEVQDMVRSAAEKLAAIHHHHHHHHDAWGSSVSNGRYNPPHHHHALDRDLPSLPPPPPSLLGTRSPALRSQRSYATTATNNCGDEINDNDDDEGEEEEEDEEVTQHLRELEEIQRSIGT